MMFTTYIKTIIVMAVVLNSPACGLSQDISKDPGINEEELEISKGFRRCPPPYTNILGECFYVHMFIPLMTWAQANTFCKQAGGILAEPTYFGAVVAQLYNNGFARKIYDWQLNRLWVGGHRDNGENATTFQWSSGRPINEKILVEERGHGQFYDLTENSDCILITLDRTEPFQLRAVPCDYTTHYICQLP